MNVLVGREREPSRGAKLSNFIDQSYRNYQNYQAGQREAEQLRQLTGKDLYGLSPEMQKAAITESLKSQGKEKILAQKQSLLQDILNGNPQSERVNYEEIEEPPSYNERSPQKQNFSAKNQGAKQKKYTPEQILALTAVDPSLGNAARGLEDVRTREERAEKEFNQRNRLAEDEAIRKAEKERRTQFESDRAYHTQFSKEADKEAEALNSVLTRKEMALDFGRNAIESGQVDAFSLANLAERTGIKELQTAKGQQLINAAKENLLSNIGRVSAKAQNQWLEQRMASIFPRIGQSVEANLTAQEMLEAETAMDKAYLTEFQKLQEQDIEEYGFERQDIAKRAREQAKTRQDDIYNRANYRIKELEEQEMGLQKLKNQVGKPVPKGAVLTLAMAKLYSEKFGKNALEMAKKNGYYIPSLEEFKIYQMTPREYRGELE